MSAAFVRGAVADHAALGIDADALDALVARVQQEIDAGRLPSAQFALARDGRVAVWRQLGDAVPESRYVMFSATKAVVAGAVWILMGEGALDVSRRVVDYIPEFGTNDKDVITVEQVMLHTSGFPRAQFAALDWDDRERRLGRFAKWRCNWEPGTRYEYHPTSAHWVLAELIERCTQQDFRAFVRERIIEPLGITGLQIGVPPAEQGDINPLVRTGSPMTRDELMAALGIPELPLTEVTPEALISFNQPAVRAVGVPGGGGVTTAADLALYYQALLHDPAGIWKPEVLADVTANVRNTMKRLHRHAREPHARAGRRRRRRPLERCAAWAVPCRPARSATTARAARSRGPTPRRACRSASSRMGSTNTSSASGSGRPRSRAEPRTACYSGDQAALLSSRLSQSSRTWSASCIQVPGPFTWAGSSRVKSIGRRSG